MEKLQNVMGHEGLPDDTITLNLTGSTGQSFMGIWNEGYNN